MSRKAGGFVVDTFHQATVTRDDIGAVVDQVVAVDRVEVTFGDGHADRSRQSLPQGTRCRFNAWQHEIFRVTGARAD